MRKRTIGALLGDIVFCVRVEGSGTEEEWTRGRMTKQRPKGGSFLKHAFVYFCM